MCGRCSALLFDQRFSISQVPILLFFQVWESLNPPLYIKTSYEQRIPPFRLDIPSSPSPSASPAVSWLWFSKLSSDIYFTRVLALCDPPPSNLIYTSFIIRWQQTASLRQFSLKFVPKKKKKLFSSKVRVEDLITMITTATSFEKATPFSRSLSMTIYIH